MAHSCSWFQKCFSFWQAGIICQLNARTSILAAANPIESQWNPKKTTIENIQLPHTLLSRYWAPACMSHFYEMLYVLFWKLLSIIEQNNCVLCSVAEIFYSTYFKCFSYSFCVSRELPFGIYTLKKSYDEIYRISVYFCGIGFLLIPNNLLEELFWNLQYC